jgi:DNA-binding response OmpR family regulator
MAPIATAFNSAGSTTRPRILVVDDEPMLAEMVSDVVGRAIACRILSAHDLAGARGILASESIDLLVADVNLPDGNGTTLLDGLHERQPHASAIVVTGSPSLDGAIAALRRGALDFLPKPFTAEHLVERVTAALQRQRESARKARRLDRLRDAVRRLNEARKLVSKKVDLLCNDLITAYGELSRQLDVVRTQEAFRKLTGEARDLEQLLCHVMDWLLRQMGYSNIAIWLASDDHEFQLGAYMKYTIAGQPALSEAMRNGLVKKLVGEGSIHWTADEARKLMTAAELKHLGGQTIMGCSCTYLGEPLAAVVLFRDPKTPFTGDDEATLRAISPLFATALASAVRGPSTGEEEGGSDDTDGGGDGPTDNDTPFADGGTIDESKPDPKKRRQRKDQSDWWKRGEPPPF